MCLCVLDPSGEARDSGGESDVVDCSSSGMGTGDQFSHPPGSAIYTMLPDGSPLPPGSVIYAPPAASLAVSPGTVIYGSPPQGAHLVYGPSSLSGPLLGVSFPTGVLHCNMPGHKEMVGDMDERMIPNGLNGLIQCFPILVVGTQRFPLLALALTHLIHLTSSSSSLR